MKLNRLIFSAAAIILSAASTANADQYSDTASSCTAALKAGDRAGFESVAEEILQWRSVFNTKAIIEARDCLTAGFGVPWEYYSPMSRFVETSSLTDIRSAQAADAQARKEEEAADAAAREAAAQSAAKELLAASTKAEINRIAVVEAVREACNELLDDNRVATLTNEVCIESFLRFGLPSE